MKASKRSVDTAPERAEKGQLRMWRPGKNWGRRQKAKEAAEYKAKADRLHPELPEEDRAMVASEMQKATRYLLGKTQ